MRLLAVLAALPVLALAGCGGDDEKGTGSAAKPAGGDFAAVVKQARGQTVRWWMYGGDDKINAYVDDDVAPALKKLGVTLKRVAVTDTADALKRVVSERRAGKTSGGGVDLIWINGEKFASRARCSNGPSALRSPASSGWRT